MSRARAGLRPVDLASGFLIVAIVRVVVFLLERKDIVMIKKKDRFRRMLNWIKGFVCKTFASFGIATILKAAMVPHAL